MHQPVFCDIPAAPVSADGAALPFDQFAANFPRPSAPSAHICAVAARDAGATVVPKGTFVVYLAPSGGPLQLAQILFPTTTAATLTDPLRNWKWRSDAWSWRGTHVRETKYAPTNGVVYPHDVGKVLLFFCPAAGPQSLRYVNEAVLPQDVVAYAAASACNEPLPPTLPQFAMPPTPPPPVMPSPVALGGAPAFVNLEHPPLPPASAGASPFASGGTSPFTGTSPVAAGAPAPMPTAIPAPFAAPPFVGGATGSPAARPTVVFGQVASFRKKPRGLFDPVTPADEESDDDDDDVRAGGNDDAPRAVDSAPVACMKQWQQQQLSRTPLGAVTNVGRARDQPRHPGEAPPVSQPQ